LVQKCYKHVHNKKYVEFIMDSGLDVVDIQ